MDEAQAEAYRAFLARSRRALLERIERAAARSGREASEVTLLAVSKTVGTDEVSMAYEAGYRVFGENRPQELKRKVDAIRADSGLGEIRFDMIGNLQKNKINQVLSAAMLVHSVSSTHLAQAIGSRAVARDKIMPCLLEVNVSGEASKSGFSPDEVTEAAEQLAAIEGIHIRGLMTMAPARDADAARRAFSGLRDLREDLKVRMGEPLEVLSCGMSGDFEIAVEEGSTLVRLGRIVFDPAYTDV